MSLLTCFTELVLGCRMVDFLIICSQRKNLVKIGKLVCISIKTFTEIPRFNHVKMWAFSVH